MANAEAQLKVTADASQAASTFSALSAGARGDLGKVSGLVGATRSAIGGLGQALGTIQQGVMSYGGLAGALGFGALLKGAIDSREQMRQLAVATRFGSGEIVSQQRIIATTTQANDRWRLGLQKTTSALATMRSQTGSFDFGAKNLDAVATTARATGHEVQQLADIAGDLKDFFKIDNVAEPLTNLISVANKGNVSLQEMQGYLSRIGASAKMAGIEGETGLRRVLGFTNFAADVTGNMRQSMQIVNQLVSAEGGETFKKKVQKALGPDAGAAIDEGMPFEQQMAVAINAAGGDRTKLEKLFGDGPGSKVATELSRKWEEAGKGKKGQLAIVDALDEAGKSMVEYSDTVKMAEDAMKDPKAQFDAAMAGLENAMQSEEIAKLISALSSLVKPTADVANQFIKFAGENPIGAMGAAMLAYVAMQNQATAAAAASLALAVDQYVKLTKESSTNDAPIDLDATPQAPREEFANPLEAAAGIEVADRDRKTGIRRFAFHDLSGKQRYYYPPAAGPVGLGFGGLYTPDTRGADFEHSNEDAAAYQEALSRSGGASAMLRAAGMMPKVGAAAWIGRAEHAQSFINDDQRFRPWMPNNGRRREEHLGPLAPDGPGWRQEDDSGKWIRDLDEQKWDLFKKPVESAQPPPPRATQVLGPQKVQLEAGGPALRITGEVTVLNTKDLGP